MRSVTTREVEWDGDQQGLMLALDLYRRETCDGCGQPLAESTRKENDYAYETMPVRCYGCETIARDRDQYMDKNKTFVHAAPSRWRIQLKR